MSDHWRRGGRQVVEKDRVDRCREHNMVGSRFEHNRERHVTIRRKELQFLEDPIILLCCQSSGPACGGDFYMVTIDDSHPPNRWFSKPVL